MEFLSEMQNSNSVMQKTVGVKLECAARTALPGSIVRAKVTIVAGTKTINASGVFIDLLDSEEVALKHISNVINEPLTHQAMNETFRIAPPFQLAANETKVFEGKFQLPINFQPTYSGRFSKHEWQIRARLETSVGDADSNFQPFKIGAGILMTDKK